MAPEAVGCQFKAVSWDELRFFLHRQRCLQEQDVDTEVRHMTLSMYCEQCVEGIYLNKELVGFARWDRCSGHLSNLYVRPSARGQGLAHQFLEERPIRTLFVMPHNDKAKRLYVSAGFSPVPSATRSRDQYRRPA